MNLSGAYFRCYREEAEAFAHRAMENKIRVDRVMSPTDEVGCLVAELEAELSGLYRPEQRHGLSLASLFQSHIRFFIAHMAGMAVGCGGIALFPDFSELKRMYVRKSARGLGVADEILRTLSAAAADAGATSLRLETGAHSTEAIRFYTRNGFRPCGAFEPYASMPPDAIIASVFMEKEL